MAGRYKQRMKIGELGGEFALIDRIAARLPSGPAVTLGIGDDAAVLAPTGENAFLLVTTDLLIEDIHFRRAWGVPPWLLGEKAIAVNVSDIAAMGGVPTATFVSLALPSDTNVEFVDDLYKGIGEACSRYGAVVAGGDTNGSPGPLVISITQLGVVGPQGPLLRSAARPGDVVLVTGALGGAAAGLAALERHGAEMAGDLHPDAYHAQVNPSPRLGEAHAAAATGDVTACMDLSDGLFADLEKLCRASGVGAVVDATRIPLPEHAHEDAEHLGGDALAWALRGGEDYELLLTVKADAAERVCAAITGATGTPVTVIGEVTAGQGVSLVGGKETPSGGWDHFTNA
jgi:thiamine-monophosphate kinase